MYFVCSWSFFSFFFKKTFISLRTKESDSDISLLFFLNFEKINLKRFKEIKERKKRNQRKKEKKSKKEKKEIKERTSKSKKEKEEEKEEEEKEEEEKEGEDFDVCCGERPALCPWPRAAQGAEVRCGN